MHARKNASTKILSFCSPFSCFHMHSHQCSAGSSVSSAQPCWHFGLVDSYYEEWYSDLFEITISFLDCYSQDVCSRPLTMISRFISSCAWRMKWPPVRDRGTSLPTATSSNLQFSKAWSIWLVLQCQLLISSGGRTWPMCMKLKLKISHSVSTEFFSQLHVSSGSMGQCLGSTSAHKTDRQPGEAEHDPCSSWEQIGEGSSDHFQVQVSALAEAWCSICLGLDELLQTPSQHAPTVLFP